MPREWKNKSEEVEEIIRSNEKKKSKEKIDLKTKDGLHCQKDEERKTFSEARCNYLQVCQIILKSSLAC